MAVMKFAPCKGCCEKPPPQNSCPCFDGTEELDGTFTVTGGITLLNYGDFVLLNTETRSFVEPLFGWSCGFGTHYQRLDLPHAPNDNFKSFTMRYTRQETISLTGEDFNVLTFDLGKGVKCLFGMRATFSSEGFGPIRADVTSAAVFSLPLTSVDGFVDCSIPRTWTPSEFIGQGHTRSSFSGRLGVCDMSQATIVYTP